MNRFTIKDMLTMPHNEIAAVYKDQIAVVNARLFGIETVKDLFAIDAFAIGYTMEGYSITEFNNDKYRLEPGNVFILAPTHTCRMVQCSQDYKVRLLLLDSNGHNLSVHLNYLVKS